MVDAVVSVLLDNLLRLLISEGRQLLVFKDQFEETKKELEYMQGFLEEANRVKRKDEKGVLKRVTSELRELVYDIEDIMADCQLLEQNCANSSNFMRNFSPRFLISRTRVGKRLHKVNLRIGKVKERMQSYLGTTPSRSIWDHEPTDQPWSNPVLMDENEIVGLEDDSAKIRGWILEENQPFMVIGMVGMGGIGKTTLAEKVCESTSVNSHFKHSLLVSVSHAFKLIDLLKRMLKNFKVEEEFIRGMDVVNLLKRLRSELDGRYLLVLDDVWETDEEMWWESLKSALPRRRGCCIIVTTRNKDVAISMGAMERHIHRPITLSLEKSWSLFSKVAFVREGGECKNHDLEEIGKEIVARCGGLPLAIKIIGGMMFTKGSSIYEWRRISEHFKEEMSDNKKDELVNSKLQLSYEELPSYLKPCYLCFAMYPEDFEIDKADIIRTWIGEGLVWGRNGKTAYEIGERCIDELLSRCLILGVGKDICERTFHYCKMHDLVRDMVIKIAREENFMCVDEKGRPTLSVQARRIGIIRNSFTETFQSNTNLRTLVWTDIKSKKIIMNIRRNICKLRWLRVLCLSFSSTSIDSVLAVDWLSGIGSLPHLVYLKIGSSAVRKLPNSLGNLRKLQILSLVDCPNLEGLPPSISNLEKLTALYLLNCPSLEFIPEGLGKLSNLEILWPVKIHTNLKYKNSFRMGQLKNLTQLREIAMIIRSKDEFEEGELNVLRELPCLKLLKIDCEGNDGSIELIEKLHHPLSPLESLQELRLGDFPSKETPPWLNPTTLPNLRYLLIGECSNLTEMGAKLYEMNQKEVWKVEVLVLKWLFNLVEVDWARIKKAMPMLRLVKIIDCGKLKSFHLDGDDEEDVESDTLKCCADEEGRRHGANAVWRKEEDGWRWHEWLGRVGTIQVRKQRRMAEVIRRMAEKKRRVALLVQRAAIRWMGLGATNASPNILS